MSGGIRESDGESLKLVVCLRHGVEDHVASFARCSPQKKICLERQRSQEDPQRVDKRLWTIHSYQRL
ncbi:hypothetical protein KIN20_003450 [Parelaphostrongylus tenuis]|uniref:Uncharacterized protein n=1 Tax=Parelaphostrongylus tenuis TaxID=148309 RepID=A0AAD5MFM5_PARTN|nr:hypothetical protein KIN20_003450 [Parelaphostrongylus tenuis]